MFKYVPEGSMNNNEKPELAFLFSFIMISVLGSASSVSYANTKIAGSKPITQPSITTEVAATAAQGTQQTSVTTPTDQSQSMTTDNAVPEQPTYSKDPLQGFNRAMFSFNDKLDILVMKPIARFYNAVTPKPLNQGIHNFFNNLGELPIIVNDILQFNFFQTTSDMWRLGINSTLGIGGLIDIASRMGIPYYANDFGLTLAHWGYTDSTYLVLPFFGPNTIRDGIGIPVDYYGFSVYPRIYPKSRRYQLYALNVVDRRAQLLQFQPVFEEVAIDKYVFTRNAYMQHRTFQIEQNKHLGYRDKLENQPK